MRELLIGDLHFGIKSNSVSWLEQQVRFIETQVFDIIDTHDLDRIVFLGDLFDIRYSIQQQVGIEVKNVIRKLAKKFDKDIIFIAGNHDYYSPLEEFSKYNAYQMVFGEEFLEKYPNITIVDSEPYLASDGGLFLPWYYTENPDHFSDLLYRYDFRDEVKAVYCHADLTIWPGARIATLKGKPVYSGHIHYPMTDTVGNLYNIGAALPLTFNDVNDDRHLLILEDYKIVEKIKNVTTPKFIRIYNKDIFTPDPEIFNNSYVQLCVSTTNINKAEYIEQIKFLKNEYIDSNIKIHLIDDTETEGTIFNGEGFQTNINEYIETNIPEHLNDKYEYIKNKLTDVE